MEVHRLTARLRTLRRFGLDLCLGRMVGTDDPEPMYVGRLGLTDRTGRQLLIDWRSAAAEPFFGATHANPMGLASRRRYRWTLRPDQRLLGRGVHPWWPPRARWARRARRPVGLHRQPGQQPVGPDARRPRHHPGRPGRHHPGRIPRRSRRRRWSGDGQDGRRPAPLRLPPLLRPSTRSPPRRRALRRAAPALPGLRRRRPPQPRRGWRADLHPAGPRRGRGSSDDRDRPGRGPPEVVRGPGDRDRGSGQVLRGAAHHGHDRRDRLVRRLAERRRLGRRVRRTGAGHAAQRGARPDLGGARHDPDGQARRRRPFRPARQVAVAERRAAQDPQPGVAAAGCG